MTVAITLTFSMPMGVFAATASLNVEEAKWTAEDEITVKFGQNVSVSDDAKDKVLASEGRELYSAKPAIIIACIMRQIIAT